MISDPDFVIEGNTQNSGRQILRMFIGKPTYDEVLAESYALKKLLLLKDDYFIQEDSDTQRTNIKEELRGAP